MRLPASQEGVVWILDTYSWAHKGKSKTEEKNQNLIPKTRVRVAESQLDTLKTESQQLTEAFCKHWPNVVPSWETMENSPVFHKPLTGVMAEKGLCGRKIRHLMDVAEKARKLKNASFY